MTLPGVALRQCDIGGLFKHFNCNWLSLKHGQ